MFSKDQTQLIRDEFSSISATYFNTAYFGPLPKRTQKNIQENITRAADPSFYSFEDWINIPNTARESIARLLDCPKKNIFHSSSTGDVVSTVAQTLKDKHHIAVINEEYPSNVLPWHFQEKLNNHQLTILPNHKNINIEYLEKNLPKNTTILNISHVSFKSGRKINIEEIGNYLKEKNILFFLDSTQALGGVKISKKELSYIDLLACSTYKWLLAPYGYAFGYLSNNLLELMKTNTTNWLNSCKFIESRSLVDYTADISEAAIKYDRGQSPNLLVMNALISSLGLFHELGLENIQLYNEHLLSHFHENFVAKNFELEVSKDFLANIVSLKSNADDLDDRVQSLRKHNIDVSVREGSLRISFHFFNTLDQVNLLLKHL